MLALRTRFAAAALCAAACVVLLVRVRRSVAAAVSPPPLLDAGAACAFACWAVFLGHPLDDAYTRALTVSTFHATVSVLLSLRVWVGALPAILAGEGAVLWLSAGANEQLTLAVSLGYFVADLMNGLVADVIMRMPSREPVLTRDAIAHHALAILSIAVSLWCHVAVLPNALFLLLEFSTPFVNAHHMMRVWSRGGNGKDGRAAAVVVHPASPHFTFEAASGSFKTLNGLLLWLSFFVLRILMAHFVTFQLAVSAWRGVAGLPLPNVLLHMAVSALMLALFWNWFIKISRAIARVLMGGLAAADEAIHEKRE